MPDTPTPIELPQATETTVFDALCNAGYVKPCISSSDDSDDVPDELCDPARILDKLDDRLDGCVPSPTLFGDRQVSGEHEVIDACLFGPVTSSEDESAVSKGPAQFPVPSQERLLSLVDVAGRAYLDTRGGASVDRVIADPEFDSLFLRRCWELGAQASAFELRWTLLYGRKNKKLPPAERPKSYSIERSRLDEFAYASEIAARIVKQREWEEHQRDVSIDKVLCEPRLREVFDQIAKCLAPGYSTFDYHWAALTLRKAGRSISGSPRIEFGDFDDLGSTDSVSVRTIPRVCGLYAFLGPEAPLFVGHAENLRRQTEIHFERNGMAVLPSWLSDGQVAAPRLLIAPTTGISASRRDCTKGKQVLKYRPRFNWLQRAGLFAA